MEVPMTAPAFAEVASEYARLWKQMTVRPDKLSLVDAAARRPVAAKDRYRAVETATGVPCSCRDKSAG
jgi:lysozyme family protein